MWIFSFPIPLAKETMFSPMYVFGSFVKNQMAVAICGLIYGSSIPLVYVSVFVAVACYLCYYGSVVLFEVKSCDTSSIALLLRIALAFQVLLCFHTNCKIELSVSIKNDIGILLEILLNL
jgi:hypothetical protein